MSQILVQVSDRLLRELETVAPARSRKRSRFIRLALQKALMEIRDVRTQHAYAALPDDEPEWFDARVWDEWAPPTHKRRARRTKRS
jgi:predicted transcriptional regulator